MFKKALIPFILYIIICIAITFIPSSEGYNNIAWKLIVGQVYALPFLLVSLILSFSLNDDKSKDSKSK